MNPTAKPTPSFFHPVGTCSIIFALLLFTNHANSQPPTANNQLPSADSLHAALTQYHQRLTAATLAEFDDATPGQWMNYVPSVGIGYNLATDAEGRITSKPRPAISFSLAQVLTARRQRLDRRAKRRSIEATADIALDDAHRQLDQLLSKYELLTLELLTMRKLHEIDESLYELAVLDYEAAKLAPSGFLPKRKAFLESELDLLRKEMEVKALEGEILSAAHY
ncbi:MAG: hypothetical protein K9J37_19745 [Saprospiraceae bacterium]|nr:hypothetical protein [Saprospiraceae bacterium]MCF8252160.1 hypothetical protein [Saprospiraceae bacterium]MCF8313829.1 hypothetical protein [Saprospiraceae bacterium]MCF8442535.1 hypothetical protein [Saprospiraceae bacterium]